jgi:predicted RNA polymerase sigma factor
VQDALVRAVATWPDQRPDDPEGWLTTTAWRRFIDLTRSDTDEAALRELGVRRAAAGSGRVRG